MTKKVDTSDETKKAFETEKNDVGLLVVVPFEVRQKLKEISGRTSINVKKLVLDALVEKYDEIKEIVKENN